MSTVANEIAAWLREQVATAGARGLVVGLSGGIDSAVVARLCQLAVPDATLAVLLPCHSDPRDEADARLAAEHFGLSMARVDLAAPYEALLEATRTALQTLPPALQPRRPVPDDPRSRLPFANLKPRLRMATLYTLANTLNCLVAGTGNRSELTIGYFTKYGDGGVDLLPIGGLLKSEVRHLACELGVPAAIVDKVPTAGLWLGQTDEEEMGFTYADLENYLVGGPETIAPALAMRIERLIRASEHKRALPPAPDLIS